MNLRTILAAVAALTMLARCGTTEPAATDAPTTGAASITVTDSRGKQVTLPGPASRVVTLEWGQTEDAVTLGVQPVGVADPTGYGHWVTAAKLTGSPVDVGLRTEPSLESVAKADPDLILGVENSIPADAVAQMEQIAPVVLLRSSDAARPLGQMRDNVTTTGKLLGKTAEADRVLADLDAKIAQGKAAIAAAKPGPFALAYINVTGNKADFRMHGPRSQPGALAAELGLTNAVTDAGDASWGLSSLDVEALTKLPADTAFWYWTTDTVADPVTTTLAKNAVWQRLPFVTAKRVEPIAGGVRLYGGPASMMQLVDAYVAAVR